MHSQLRLEKRHPHDLQFSPYFPNRLACATGQFYGLAGSGALVVIILSENGGPPAFQSYPWSDALFAVTWSEKNENILITGAGDGTIQVYDVNVVQGPASVFKAHEREVSAVDWCQSRLVSHLFLTASWDKSAKIWDGESMKCVSSLPNIHEGMAYDVKSSPLCPGVFATVSSDSYVKVWDVHAPQKVCAAWKAHHPAETLAVDWCKYDQYTVATSGTDGLIKVWDTRSPGYPKTVLPGHQYAVKRIKFSPYHSSVLVSASYDFSVKVWNYLVHNHPIKTFDHHTEFVCGLDFNLHVPDQVASASWDELVSVWSISVT